MATQNQQQVLQKQLLEIQTTIYDKIPKGRSIYFITICIPYKYKVYDIVTFTKIAKVILSIFEKHLLKHDRRWTQHLYDFDAFFENKNNEGQYHMHLIATFIDKNGKQLSKDYIEQALIKTSNTMKRFYHADRNLDYDIKLVPYEEANNIIGYCTKEIIAAGYLNTNKLSVPYVLFGLQKVHRKRKNLTKTQRQIRKAKTKEELAEILYSKFPNK